MRRGADQVLTPLKVVADDKTGLENPRPLSGQQGMFDSAQDVSVSEGTFNNVTSGSIVVNINHRSNPRRTESFGADASGSVRLGSSPHQHGSAMEPISHIKPESFDVPLTLPLRPRPNISDSRIYHEQMLLKGRGTPLWHPSPNRRLPKCYRREGINIGDVGTINEFGAFCFLFNIFEEAWGEVNAGLVPAEFQPLRWISFAEHEGNSVDNVGVRLRDVEEQRVYDDGSWLGTGAIEEIVESGEGGHTFRTRACEGAILTMPFGATSKDLVNRQLLQDYMIANLEEWYIYANRKRGRQAQNGDIRLVYGCDKVSSWGIATFHREQIVFDGSGPDRTLRFAPVKSERRTIAGSLTKFAWGSLNGGSGRAGPTDLEIRDLVDQPNPNTVGGLTGSPDAPIENQCVFIRTLNAMLCQEGWERTMGGLSPGYRDSGSGSQQPQNWPGGNSSFGGDQGGQPRDNSSGSSSQSSHLGPGSIIQFTSMEGQPIPLVHPSESLNRLLLRRFPRSRMVVTADSDWLAVLETMQCIALQNMTSFDDRKFLKLGVHPLHFERVLAQSYEIVEDRDVVLLKMIQTQPTGRPSCRRRLKRHDTFFSQKGDLLVIAKNTAFRLHYRHLNKTVRGFISVYTMRHSRRRKILDGAFEYQFEDLLASYYQVSLMAPQDTIKKEEDHPIVFSSKLAEPRTTEPVRKSSPHQTDLKNSKLQPINKELGSSILEPRSIPLELEIWFDIVVSTGIRGQVHRKEKGSINEFIASQSLATANETAISTRPISKEPRPVRISAKDLDTTSWPAQALKSSTCLYCTLRHKKCHFRPEKNICNRCAKGGQVCIVGSNVHKAPRRRNMSISYQDSQLSFHSKIIDHKLASEAPLFNAQPSISQGSLPLDAGETHYRKPSSVYTLLTSNKRPREEAGGYFSHTAFASSGQSSSTTRRLPGACTQCKRLKVKCTFASGTGRCQRCSNSGHECVVLGRKPRGGPSKSEQLLLQIRSQSNEIERLRTELMKVKFGLSAEHFYSEQEKPTIHGATNAILYNSDSNNSSFEDVRDSTIPEQYAVAYNYPVDDNGNPDTEEGTHSLDQHQDEKSPTASVKSLKNSATLREEVQTNMANKDSNMSSTQFQWPTMLILSIISPQEVQKLFSIYFTAINPSISLLDPDLCTVTKTLSRSPFLFTVVCAVASEFDSERPELHQHAMQYAQLAAGTALINGEKNLEMCQAYLLLSLYHNSPMRTEEGSTWLYLGLAIRIATDLNLHVPNLITPLNEAHRRELANRGRIWLNCFNLDHSLGLQYCKPTMISSNDYNACHSENWWRLSPREMRDADILLCANVAKWNLLHAFIARMPGGSDHSAQPDAEGDLEAYASVADDHFQIMSVKWTNTLEVNSNLSLPENSFRQALLKLILSHARLVALFYGFQQRSSRNYGVFPLLRRCLNAASDIVSAVSNICTSSQNQYWECGPESLPILVSFVAAFLVKVLQSSLVMMLSQEERTHMLEQAQGVIFLLETLGSDTAKQSENELCLRYLRTLLGTSVNQTSSSSNPLHQKNEDIISFHSLSKAVTGLDCLPPSLI